LKNFEISIPGLVLPTQSHALRKLDRQAHNWAMPCSEYIRLRQHHEAALTHWEHVQLSLCGANTSPAVLEVKKKAWDERNTLGDHLKSGHL
jgi:hypothetical protein